MSINLISRSWEYLSKRPVGAPRFVWVFSRQANIPSKASLEFESRPGSNNEGENRLIIAQYVSRPWV